MEYIRLKWLEDKVRYLFMVWFRGDVGNFVYLNRLVKLIFEEKGGILFNCVNYFCFFLLRSLSDVRKYFIC